MDSTRGLTATGAATICASGNGMTPRLVVASSISSSTHDAGTTLSIKYKGFVHHIAPEIDDERSTNSKRGGEAVSRPPCFRSGSFHPLDERRARSRFLALHSTTPAWEGNAHALIVVDHGFQNPDRLLHVSLAHSLVRDRGTQQRMLRFQGQSLLQSLPPPAPAGSDIGRPAPGGYK